MAIVKNKSGVLYPVMVVKATTNYRLQCHSCICSVFFVCSMPLGSDSSSSSLSVAVRGDIGRNASPVMISPYTYQSQRAHFVASSPCWLLLCLAALHWISVVFDDSVCAQPLSFILFHFSLSLSLSLFFSFHSFHSLLRLGRPLVTCASVVVSYFRHCTEININNIMVVV